MPQVITAPIQGDPPTLSMPAIAALKQGVEEAIAMALRGEVTRIEIAVLKKGRVVKEWVENAGGA